MKITDILNTRNMTLSFEVFPPKKETSFESVRAATEEIAGYRPSFMSVTYGAGGGTSKFTLDIAKNIKEKFGVPTLAHLTCVSSSKQTVHEQIEALRKADIKNIMALRGDLTPELEKTDRSQWDYCYAVQLIRELRETGDEFCIGAACYPEIHPESRNQMVFDNNLFFNFMYKLREAGVTVPVIPGIMPITNAVQVERAVKLSGSFMPQRFKSLVDYFGQDPASMKQAGIAYATDQIIDLYANGITNVHVYSMNKPDVAKAIKDNLSDILGKDFNR